MAGVEEPEVASRKEEVLYKADEEKLRSIFPPETWEIILKKLSPEDKENCANASPYFWQLLQKQRSLFLFPKVIQVMALISEPSYYISKVVTAEEKDKAPLVKPEKLGLEINAEEWKATVLNCRLVCKSWNEAVENCYEKPEMTGISELVNVLDPRSKWNNVSFGKWTKQTFPEDSAETPELARLFVERFDQSHHSGTGAPPKNPFLGRYVCIKIEEYFPECANDATKMLEKFGKYIWYLEVDIEDMNLFFYIKLRTWLGLVPNLKYLEVHSDEKISKIKNRKGEIVHVCFPKLEKLEGLYVKNLGSQFASELIRKNCHVTYLKLKNMDELEEDIENSLEMPNIQRFSIKKSLAGEKMLENLGPSWKNVKKFYHERGNGRSVEPTVGMGAPKAFTIFQTSWAETLTDLYLDHPFGYDDETILEESQALRLNLPGVRKFTLREFRAVFLDFALPLNGLEHLIILFDNGRYNSENLKRVEMQQNIQLQGFQDRMEISNIWQVFGKLKTVSVQYRLGSIALVTKEKEKFQYFKKK